MLASILAICAGASLGAVLRWVMATHLNPLVPQMLLGTLAVNLAGGYLVGIAVAIFAAAPHLGPHARLFAITGFLGGFTTFSAFSAEVTTQLQEGHFSWAFATVMAHVAGSLVMTMLGMWTVAFFRRG